MSAASVFLPSSVRIRDFVRLIIYERMIIVQQKGTEPVGPDYSRFCAKILPYHQFIVLKKVPVCYVIY